MERIIFGILNCAGIYFITLLFIGTAFKNRRKLDNGKTAGVVLLGLAAMGVVTFTVLDMFSDRHVSQYVAVAFIAAILVLICSAIYRCSVLETLFVYYVVKNLTDVIFMVSKFIQVYIVMRIVHISEQTDFIIAYSVSTLIALPLIYMFMKRLIRPCIDITEGMPFWKLLWMLPVFYYIIYKMGISPDYPSPEVIWNKTVIILPLIWGMGTTLSYAIMVSALTDIARLTKDRERLRASRQQVKLQQEQYHRLQDSIEETARIRHDWRQQLVMLQGYAQKDDCASIRDYLERYMEETKALKQVSVCENFAVDSIARHYISKAQNCGIEVEASFHIPESFPVREEEMCVVLGNLLENAVEACRRQENGRRFLKAKVSTAGANGIAIVIENSYNTQVQEKNGVFLSSKREGEGIGISSVRHLVEKNNGVVKFEYGQGIFKVSVFMNSK